MVVLLLLLLFVEDVITNGDSKVRSVLLLYEVGAVFVLHDVEVGSVLRQVVGVKVMLVSNVRTF